MVLQFSTDMVYMVYVYFELIKIIFVFPMKVLASQKRLENKYKAAQQASEDW